MPLNCILGNYEISELCYVYLITIKIHKKKNDRAIGEEYTSTIIVRNVNIYLTENIRSRGPNT